MIEHEIIDAEIQIAVARGKVSATQFVDYVNQANAIFSGLRVVARLLRDDLSLSGIEGEQDRLMSIDEKDALIGMIRAVSWEMERRACDIQGWARERIKEGKA